MNGLKEIYEKMEKILRKYIIMDECYYPVVSMWLLGTYFHDNFQTYPYLFFNAMKGSGKTRMLHLLAKMAKNGKIVANITESVLFRTASESSYFIDEIENIRGKQSTNLRLLLNAAYKRGTTVPRSRKVKDSKTEDYVVDEFDVFTPVSMANIGGMDEVLEDRCITIILERSNDPYITRMIEDWDNDPDIIELGVMLDDMKNSVFFGESCNHSEVNSVPSVVYLSDFKTLYTLWNHLLYTIRDTLTTQHTQDNTSSDEGTLTTYTTYTTIHTLPTYNNVHHTLDKLSRDDVLQIFSQLDFDRLGVEPTADTTELIGVLWDCELNGRDMELWMPLIALSYYVDPGLANMMVDISEQLCEEKKMEDMAENRDMSLLGHLVSMTEENTSDDFIQVGDIAASFQNDSNEEWASPTWVGRALKRLKVTIEKRRVASGVQVRLNCDKIRRKARKMGMDVKLLTHGDQMTVGGGVTLGDRLRVFHDNREKDSYELADFETAFSRVEINQLKKDGLIYEPRKGEWEVVEHGKM